MDATYPAAHSRAVRNHRRTASASPLVPAPEPAPVFIDSKTAAKRLAIDPDSVRRLARQGRIKGYLIGARSWRFDLASVDRYVASCLVRPHDKRSPLRDDDDEGDDDTNEEGAGRSRVKGARHA